MYFTRASQILHIKLYITGWKNHLPQLFNKTTSKIYFFIYAFILEDTKRNFIKNTYQKRLIITNSIKTK